MSSKQTSFRLPNELVTKLKEEAKKSRKSLTEVLVKYLEDGIRVNEKGLIIRGEIEDKPSEDKPTEKVKPIKPRERLRYKYDKFIIPVGNIVYGVDKWTTPVECSWRMLTWWCPPDKVEHVRKLAAKWCDNGFSFHVGDKEDSTLYEPDVITTEEQQRGVNLRFSPSFKGVPALIGDKKVWLEIDDPVKAYEFLQKNTDIPCAVMYTNSWGEWEDLSDEYEKAFSLAQKYFTYYYQTGKPYKLTRDEYDPFD